MTFANPNYLWLLLAVIPALAVFFIWASRKRQQLATRFIQMRLLPGLLAGTSPVRQRVRFILFSAAVTCLIVALARPQWGFSWEEVRQRGLDIVVAIDTSKSMLTEDIPPNRLARAKLAALDLMQQAKSDRLGLVAFAGTAFLQCPLTIDDSAFRQCVEALDINTLPQGGTALAAAIQTALTAFKEGGNVKVLVLFSDGEDHESGALEAAEAATKAGLEIFTIGIGSTEGEMVRLKKPDGTVDFVRDEQGNAVQSKLQEGLLRQIAGASSRGFYLPLRGAKTIDTLFEQGLAPLPKSDAQQKLVRQFRDRFHWPLALALLLITIEMLLPERKRRGKTVISGTGSVAVSIGILVATFALAGAVQASTAGALRQYKSGNYGKALQEYEKLLEKRQDDPRLNFNAGAAAYQNGQMEEAQKRFEKALVSPDLNLQEMAYYNRGNAQYWLGEANPDPQKRQESWTKSLQDYGSALKLNPQDADAKFNQEFVKKRLEELKEQQQKQQQQDQGKDNKEQQDQKQQQQDQKSQDQQQQQQQKQEPEQKPEEQQQQQQGQKDAQQSQDQAKKQAEENQSKKQEQGAEEKKRAEQAKESADPTQEKEAKATSQPGEMTPEEASRLLDAQKEDEKILQFKPEAAPNPTRRLKDW